MSESKHTPGPWEACERGDYLDDGIVILGDDMRIAVVNREEDASLIAAAPEMYEALRNALEAGLPEEVAKSARAALAKAE